MPGVIARPPTLSGTEHQHQAAAVQWARTRSGPHDLPALRYLIAIPNGGVRHPAVATQLRAEGVRAGVADLFLPVPVASHPGCWLEVKRPSVTWHGVSPEQRDWLSAMGSLGYAVGVAFGVDAIVAALLAYLDQWACPVALAPLGHPVTRSTRMVAAADGPPVPVACWRPAPEAA